MTLFAMFPSFTRMLGSVSISNGFDLVFSYLVTHRI